MSRDELRELLERGKPMVCAEGYVLELQRRGYVQSGVFVPDVILRKPQLIRALHEEFAHAGSDVLVACLYYVNKAKLAQVDLADKFEAMNRQALDICRHVAYETDTLMAGNLCNSLHYKPDDPNSVQTVHEMFRDQVTWASNAGADMFVCESYREYGEALLALNAVKTYAPGTPCVVTLSPFGATETSDGVGYAQAVARLSAQGAAVAGLNCATGPDTIIPILRHIRRTFKGNLAALPIPFRTTTAEPTWSTLTDKKTGKLAFPDDLPTQSCSCAEIERFGAVCLELDINYVGLCCGNSAAYTRVLAEAVGHPCPPFDARPAQQWKDIRNDAFFKNCFDVDA